MNDTRNFFVIVCLLLYVSQNTYTAITVPAQKTLTPLVDSLGLLETQLLNLQEKLLSLSLRPSTELWVSKQDLRDILNKQSGGITCVRGHYKPVLTKAGIKRKEEEMESYLASNGLKFIRADGYYPGHIPNSYIILDIKEPDLIALANNFAQDSVILFKNGSAKLLHLMEPDKNSFNLARSWKEISEKGQNCTEVHVTDGDGVFRFAYNFNVVRLHKKNT